VAPALLKRYQARRDEFTDSLRRFCLGRGIGHVQVVSDTPVDRLVLEVLRKGGMLT